VRPGRGSSARSSATEMLQAPTQAVAIAVSSRSTFFASPSSAAG
jgi:hypothetical protein